MKSSKIWKIIWVSGIYILLFVILYLIVVYKVKWEHKDLNTYLYIYSCGENICTSSNNSMDYYNKILCEEHKCPYITDIVDNNLVLKKDDKSWIYNYVSGEVVDNNYKGYRYLYNDLFVVYDNENKYGIIDKEGNIIVDSKYGYIDDYKNDYISYKENELYGIVNEKLDYKLTPFYEDIVLINDKIFAGRIDNVYQLHSYNNVNDNNANKYNFVYSYEDTLLVVNNKKIDILDKNLNSTLLMKISSFYDYTTEKERSSLKIRTDGLNIYFRVYTDEEKYTDYVYNIKNKKIM